MNKVFGILILTISMIGAWLVMDYRTFLAHPLELPEPGIIVTVEKGTSVRQLANRMQDSGIIKQALYLRLYARINKLASKVKAGEYWLETGITPVQLFDQLIAGKVTSYSFTLVEGQKFSDFVTQLKNDKVLTQTLVDTPINEIMSKVTDEDIHPEGQFLPETYYFPRGMTDIALLKRAHSQMHSVLDKAWKERAKDLPYKTPYEALIMASIIEKETGQAAEREEIAGVFVRRLNKGMRLQTDPTVIYGMGDRYKGNIRRSDLRESTPYNTYVINGLPPTPICLPGKASILAALNPKQGKALYFVAKGNGEHYFSATLKEHNAAVRKYQLKK